MTANAKALGLRRKLFDLVAEYKTFQQECWAASDENAVKAHDQADQAACQLAGVYESLPDLFTDAARDEKDQSFGFNL